MNKKRVFLVLILSIFLLAGYSFSQEKKKVTDVEEISLEELLNQEVTVASKKAQKVEEAPAIISVITKKEIIERGYLNLYDALTSLPGINSVQTYWGFNQLFFRGIYSPLYNDKSLVLINGHPFWDSINGSYYIEAFPMEAVKRIEVIRGPGSTLYGTNAFAGVINIVTEDGESEKSSGYIRGSSYSTLEGSLVVSGKSDEFKYVFSAGERIGSGYLYTIPVDEIGKENSTTDFVLNFTSFYGALSYKGFKISTYSFLQEKSKVDVMPAVFGDLSNNHNKWAGYFVMADYKGDLGDKASFSIRASYNYFDRKFPSLYGGFTMLWSKGERYDGEASISYVVNDKTSLIFGVGYENASEDFYDFFDRLTMDVLTCVIDEHGRSDSSFFTYIQGDSKLSDKIEAVAGVRYVNNKDYGSFLTPRGGIVFKLKENLFFKTLYGEAFRAPNLMEKYIQFGVTVGSIDLQPEKIKTVDIGLDWIYKNRNFRINYFYTIVNDLIGRYLDETDGKTHYTNFEGESTYMGAEFEIRGKLVGKTTFFLNGSYLTGEDSDGEEIPYVPDYLSNGGITYNGKKILASFYYNYVSKTVNPTINGDVEIDPAFVLNAKFGYKLSDKLTLSIIAHNVFDQEIWAPEFVRRKIGMLQNGPGRLIYLELRKVF